MRRAVTDKMLKTHPLILAFVFILSALILLPFYKYQVNPDGISLINISTKILKGDISSAVNGYWSMLAPILLIPFMFFIKNPLIAFKVFSISLGFITVFAFSSLISVYIKNLKRRALLLLFSLPAIAYFTFSVTSSDFLFALTLIIYFTIVSSEGVLEKKNSFLKIAFSGFIIYAAKGYGFMFFTAHFALISIIEFFGNNDSLRRKILVKNVFMTYALFFLLSLTLVIPISIKYGKITFSTSGYFNYAAMSPDSRFVREPFEHALPPSDSLSLSHWDDPSETYRTTWSPFDSKEAFIHQAKLVKKNVPWFADLANSFSYASILIIASALFIVFAAFFKKRFERKLSYLLFTYILYAGGYILIVLEQRYFWFLAFIIYITGYLTAEKIIKKKSILIIIMIILGFSFVVMPLKNLKDDIYANRSDYMLYKGISENFSIDGSIASNINRGKMTILAFYFNEKYYGAFGENLQSAELSKELFYNDVKYYFLFDNDSSKVRLDSNWVEITSGKYDNFLIYRFNDNE